MLESVVGFFTRNVELMQISLACEGRFDRVRQVVVGDLEARPGSVVGVDSRREVAPGRRASFEDERMEDLRGGDI